MRFEPCVWPKGYRRKVTPQRLAAARRAVAQERDRNALTPELIREHFRDPLERIAFFADRDEDMAASMRLNAARSWRDARENLAALPPVLRESVRRFWAAGIYPASPAYLSTLIHQVRGGRSLWRFLRWRRAAELIREGLLDRSFLPELS